MSPKSLRDEISAGRDLPETDNPLNAVRIVSNGLPTGTRVYLADGTEIRNVISISWSMRHDGTAHALIEVEATLEGVASTQERIFGVIARDVAAGYGLTNPEAADALWVAAERKRAAQCAEIVDTADNSRGAK